MTADTLPLHQRIRREIGDQIRSGVYRPGDRIPFEHELMARYGCARMTVNTALSALVKEGLIERRKRAGTFVRAQRLDSTVLDIPDIEVEVRARGEDYAFRLIDRVVRQPATAEEQALGRGGEILILKGLHYAGGRCLAHEDRAIGLVAVPNARDVDFAAQSPGHWLLAEVPWTRAETQISAEIADMPLAEVTGWPRGAACLVVARQTWRGRDPVTRVRQVFDAAAYRLTATIDHS